MRILYASQRPPYPFFLGGAARCAHILLHQMSGELDVTCAAVGSRNYTVTPWSLPEPSEHVALGIKSIRSNGREGVIDCGYPVHVLPDFSQALHDFIDKFKPDIIWAQLEGAREVLELASAKNIQGLLYVHDAEFDPVELIAMADLGCHVVCSSGFLAKKVRQAIGREAHVIYPASELYFDTTSDSSGTITMINPVRVKGVDTFFEIAKRLPSEKFLLLESWKLNKNTLAELKARLTEVPNVTFQQRVSDMRSVYGQTKLLLVPSVWEEGFGMVSIEAQSCCIPVIASARGGLPESVGDGGIIIEDYQNVKEWVEAINHTLVSPDTYAGLRKHAYSHAACSNFAPSELTRRFLEICKNDPEKVGFISRKKRAFHRAIARSAILSRLFG